ncbi:ATP-binding protein [Burkholderia sp. BCC0322]|uniref:ATP-binding protein n=1 Tax=unclassified Burkholderia TaxID=2613784 RepID=UPI00158C7BB4|nr:ATP-binding protein [Burkholderia sp. BCC0322]
MLEDIHRPVALDQHPLRRRTYRVPTPSIAAFRTLIDECLFLYITGALIHGRPRMGKSYAIEFLRRDLELRYPKLSVYLMRCPRSQTASENNFFSSLLHTVKHPAQSGAPKAALRGRLLHKLRQVADHKGDDRVVLFADEAQNLREIEYEWLRDLHDEMESNALRLFTFLVGQPQLLAQKSVFQAQDKEQIIARFMVDELAFRGIASAAECAAVLAAYDNGEFPADSDWSYVRFFVPKAHAAGLRIAESAAKLWDAFEDAHIKANLEGPVEIPMKYFTAAVEAALQLGSVRDSETLQFDALYWSEMVERSRYVVAQKAGRPMLSAIILP